MATPINLGNQSNPGRDFRDGSGRLINCYVEPRGQEGRHANPIYPVDGLDVLAELPVQTESEDEGILLNEDGDLILSEVDSDTFILEGDPFAGQQNNPDLGVQVIIPDRGYLWVVTGRGVYKVGQGGEATFIGAIAGSKAITADINRVNEIGIVSDGNYYVCDTVNETVIDYTDQLTIFSAPNSVVHYNGYMVVSFSNGAIQRSDLNAATTWQDTNVTTTTFRGDGLRRLLTVGGDLLCFGSDSIEWLQDTGATATFNFQRVAAATVGISAPLSAGNLDEVALFIDNDFAVRLVQGYKTSIVSSSFVSRKIRKAAAVDSIRATTHERDGHLFYSISCSDFTLTYDLSTETWHEEKTGEESRRIINAIAKLNNTYYAGNYKEGVVYTMSSDLYQDATTPIVMEIITPPVHAFPDKIRVKSLYIDAMFGTALAADVIADESDPKLMVWISEDDGENFVFLEELSLGDINSKYEELRIQGVGTSDQNGFVFRLTCSTPVVRGVLGMSADMTKVRA